MGCVTRKTGAFGLSNIEAMGGTRGKRYDVAIRHQRYQDPLKLHLAQNPNQNVITGYGSGYVLVGSERYDRNIIVTPKTIISDWPVNPELELRECDFAAMIELAPQIILIGSGKHIRFPKSAALRGLLAARIGYEVMDTRAACRTYNILLEEGRNVAAALMIGA